MGEKLAKLWREIVWPWSPESERESSEAIVRNLWLHWFPAKITRAAMSWNYSLWLGTAAASLFFILTVTGVMLMFFYVPSTERAYGSIKDLQYAVSFGRVLRNQHRWAAEGMVAVVFLHMARVFLPGPIAAPGPTTGWSASCCYWERCCFRLPATCFPGIRRASGPPRSPPTSPATCPDLARGSRRLSWAVPSTVITR